MVGLGIDALLATKCTGETLLDLGSMEAAPARAAASQPLSPFPSEDGHAAAPPAPTGALDAFLAERLNA